MTKKLLQFIGWYGVMAIITAYGLLNFNVIEVKSLTYLLLNLTGSIAVMTEALSKKDIQPVVLNIIWAAVAILGIIGALTG